MKDKGFSRGAVVVYHDPRDRFYNEQVRQSFSLLSRREVEAVMPGQTVWIPHTEAIPHGGMIRGTYSAPHTFVKGFRKIPILKVRPFISSLRPKRFEYFADVKHQVRSYITVDGVMLQKWFWKVDEDRLHELTSRFPVSLGLQEPSVA